jgi:hypothetical protein
MEWSFSFEETEAVRSDLSKCVWQSWEDNILSGKEGDFEDFLLKASNTVPGSFICLFNRNIWDTHYVSHNLGGTGHLEEKTKKALSSGMYCPVRTIHDS